MAREIKARFVRGRLEPEENLDLKEGEEVTVTIQEVPSAEDATEAFRRAAGGWEGIVDAESLLRDISASRKRQSRPVDLGL